MALPRSARLRDGRDIQAVSRLGARARSGDVTVAVRVAGDRPARAVVVIGRRAGGAVERNRLRRRLQHVVADHVVGLPIGADVVVRSGPEAATLSPDALEAALTSGLRRAPRAERDVSPAARLLAALVVGYQHVLSPLLGPRCRFEPTCSHYAHEALVTHGALRGVRLVVWRLLRCQPFGTPGYDPVPEARPRSSRPDPRRPAALRGAGPC